MGALAISADSHIVEPSEVFERVVEQFGDRAPRIVQHPEWGDFLTTPRMQGHPDAAEQPGLPPGLPVGRVGIAGRRLNDPETQQVIRQGYAGMRPSISDPNLRIKDQDLDGVAAEFCTRACSSASLGLQRRTSCWPCFAATTTGL